MPDFLGNFIYVAQNKLFEPFLGDSIPPIVGGLRPAQVYLPDNFDGVTAAPLLVLLHGYSRDSYYTSDYMKVGTAAAALGMFYIAPDGIRNPVNERFWKATDACCDFLDMGWDDSQYLIDLVDEISAKYPIDQSRIYFTGHSNGGFMAHRMACNHADRIAAIASFAGMQFKDLSKCKPSEPISVLQIHGTADTKIMYAGDTLVEVEFPSAEVTVADWIQLNGCTANSLVAGTPFNLDTTLAGDETIPYIASGCPAGIDVEFWKIVGAVHTPKLDASFSAKVLAFFIAHPKV